MMMGEKLICFGRYPEACSRQYYEKRLAELEQRIEAAIRQGHVQGLIEAKNKDRRAALRGNDEQY